MKRFLLFIFIVLFAKGLMAENRYGVSLGVNLGGIKTNWQYVDDPEVFARFGYSFGFGAEFELRDHIALLIDLNMVSKNYAITPDYYGPDVEGFDRYSLLYLDLPVRVSYNHRNMRIFAGPFLDYYISGTNRYNFIYPDNTINEGNISIKSGKEFSDKEIRSNRLAVNYLDGGIIFGVGYRNDSYCIDLSYSQGLLNISPNIEGGPGRKENITMTRMLMLNLFFYF
jgi:hypothetical protein